MKNTGVSRPLDELGRVVLPIELRRTLGIKKRDPLEIFVDHDQIILKVYQPGCVFCNELTDDIRTFRGKRVCGDCAHQLESKVLTTTAY